MKKNIIVILFCFLFFYGCTSVSIKKNPKYQSFFSYYDKWELEKAELEIFNIEDIKDKKNLTKKLENRKENKLKLNNLLVKLKTELESNNFTTFDKHLKKGFINDIKYKKLKEINFTDIKIFLSKPKFYRESSTVVVLAKYIDDTVYFEIIFELEKDKWYISSFNEKG